MNKKKNLFESNGTLYDYQTYIKSKEWVRKRVEYFSAYKKVCVLCACENEKEIQVHHLSYLNLGNESVNDLVALCNKCHFEIAHNQFNTAKEKKAIDNMFKSRKSKYLINPIAKVKKEVHVKIKNKKIYPAKTINYYVVFNKKNKEGIILNDWTECKKLTKKSLGVMNIKKCKTSEESITFLAGIINPIAKQIEKFIDSVVLNTIELPKKQVYLYIRGMTLYHRNPRISTYLGILDDGVNKVKLQEEHSDSTDTQETLRGMIKAMKTVNESCTMNIYAGGNWGYKTYYLKSKRNKWYPELWEELRTVSKELNIVLNDMGDHQEVQPSLIMALRKWKDNLPMEVEVPIEKIDISKLKEIADMLDL